MYKLYCYLLHSCYFQIWRQNICTRMAHKSCGYRQTRAYVQHGRTQKSTLLFKSDALNLNYLCNLLPIHHYFVEALLTVGVQIVCVCELWTLHFSPKSLLFSIRRELDNTERLMINTSHLTLWKPIGNNDLSLFLLSFPDNSFINYLLVLNFSLPSLAVMRKFIILPVRVINSTLSPLKLHYQPVKQVQSL